METVFRISIQDNTYHIDWENEMYERQCVALGYVYSPWQASFNFHGFQG